MWFESSLSIHVDKTSSKFCRSTLLICVWQIKFFNTKQFQYCWIAFSLKEIGKLMCYKTLNDKNTHLIAWNEILTQFGECDSLPSPVCAVAEPGAHAHSNSTTIQYFFFTRGTCGSNYEPPHWFGWSSPQEKFSDFAPLFDMKLYSKWQNLPSLPPWFTQKTSQPPTHG